MQALFAITPTAYEVPADGLIPLSQIARRISPAIVLDSNSITIPGGECKTAYYQVSGTVTFTAPTADDVSIELRKDGVAVPGIVSSASVTTVNTQLVTLPIEGIVKVDKGTLSVLTIVNTGVAISLVNCALSVVRIY